MGKQWRQYHNWWWEGGLPTYPFSTSDVPRFGTLNFSSSDDEVNDESPFCPNQSGAEKEQIPNSCSMRFLLWWWMMNDDDTKLDTNTERCVNQRHSTLRMRLRWSAAWRWSSRSDPLGSWPMLLGMCLIRGRHLRCVYFHRCLEAMPNHQ